MWATYKTFSPTQFHEFFFENLNVTLHYIFVVSYTFSRQSSDFAVQILSFHIILSDIKVLLNILLFHKFFHSLNRCSTAERAGYYLDAALTSRSTNMAADLTGRDSHFIFSLHVYQYSVENNKKGLQKKFY